MQQASFVTGLLSGRKSFANRWILRHPFNAIVDGRLQLRGKQTAARKA